MENSPGNGDVSERLRDQITQPHERRIKRNLGTTSRDTLTNIFGKEIYFRHLQRIRRDSANNFHPCVDKMELKSINNKLVHVATCKKSINTGCWSAVDKYATPLCAEKIKYDSKIGKTVVYDCGCAP